MLTKRKKSGFTLAEILVTLGVIGVIASMTVPTLVQDIQDAQFKIAYKKMFADLSQATKLLVNENSGSLKGLFVSSIDVRNFYSKYLNYTKFCTNSRDDGCWHDASQWVAMDGTPREARLEGGYILSNGGLLVLIKNDCNPYCAQLLIDVNGIKGPNRIAKDIYQLLVYENALYPFGVYGNEECEGTTGVYSGWGCSAKYLYQ